MLKPRDRGEPERLRKSGWRELPDDAVRNHQVEQSHDPALEDRWFTHMAFHHVSRQVSGLGGLSGKCRVFLGSFLPNQWQY